MGFTRSGCYLSFLTGVLQLAVAESALCPVIPKPGLLSSVTRHRKHVVLCTVHPAVRVAVEAPSPSLFFLSHLVGPVTLGRLLEKIT